MAPSWRPWWGSVAVAAVVLVAVVASQALFRPVQEVRIAATPSGFVPAEVRVRAGIPTRLIVTSVDADHRVTIPGMEIQATVHAGKTTTVDLIPEVPGRYSFSCEVYCGPNHSQFIGTLVVE